jgi:hypothetical protein
MKPSHISSCALAITAFFTAGVHAAVGLEDVCFYYNAVSSTTTGFKVAAKISLWKGSVQCGTLTVDPGATTCYYYSKSATCNTAATAANIAIVEPLYVNGTLTIPISTAYSLTGTSGTTGIEHLTVSNGAWVSTAATPSVITAGTAYTITADYLEPGFRAVDEASAQ